MSDILNKLIGPAMAAARAIPGTAAASATAAAAAAAVSAAEAAASAASSDGAAAQAMVADAEASTTASAKHDTGEYFCLNGTLYVATADIAIGDTITVGTNCTAAVIGDDLSNLKTEMSAAEAAIEDLEAGSLSALGATQGQVPVADGEGSWAWGGGSVAVSGATPAITAQAGVRYVCGECSTLTIVTPASGIIDVVFESGSTPTVLTVTPPTGMTMKWAGGFDPTSLDANTVYEVNIMDGVYGVVGKWT